MKLVEVLPAFEAGKKIRRSIWPSDAYINNLENSDLLTSELLNGDWEILEEPKRTVKVKLLAYTYIPHSDKIQWNIAHFPEYIEVRGDWIRVPALDCEVERLEE
jgi:hypothetical protein